MICDLSFAFYLGFFGWDGDGGYLVGVVEIEEFYAS